MKKAILLDPKDSVLTVLEDVHPGDLVGNKEESITALEEIPIYHKISRSDYAYGDKLYKYGEQIGYATAPITKGSWIHTHNLQSHPVQ